jgi:hypothetical protein
VVFPKQKLSESFGRGDAEYAIEVFQHHRRQLQAAGFTTAEQVLEVGPGRNLGTAILMWAWLRARGRIEVSVTMVDAFENMSASENDITESAQNLLIELKNHGKFDENIVFELENALKNKCLPEVKYIICPLNSLKKIFSAGYFDLVYSHAALEHVWEISDFWMTAVGLTRNGGWHSHRIDLADHGRRNGNYLEMLQWSPAAYWLTMRFIPGAVNRWRAATHLECMTRNGLHVLSEGRESRDALPVERSSLHRSFQGFSDAELRTTALDVVATHPSHPAPSDKASANGAPP